MAITAAICNSFKQELKQAIHDEADVYKIALYLSAATLDKSTTVYSATNEVSGAGYTAGGQILTGYTEGFASDVAWIDWADPSWSGATISPRGALIYNSSKANRAVQVLDFGSDIVSTGGILSVQLPVAAAGTALLRIA